MSEAGAPAPAHALEGVQRSLDRLANGLVEMRREVRDDAKVMHDRISAHNQRIETMIKESRAELVRRIDRQERRLAELERAEQQRAGARVVRGGLIGTALTVVSAFLAALLIGAAKKLGVLE